MTIHLHRQDGMQTYWHSIGRSGNSDPVDGKDSEVNMLFTLLDLRRPINIVCCCGKQIQAILRRIFHGRTIISSFLIPSLRKQNSCSPHRLWGPPASAHFADRSLHKGWHHRYCPSQFHGDPSICLASISGYICLISIWGLSWKTQCLWSCCTYLDCSEIKVSILATGMLHVSFTPLTWNVALVTVDRVGITCLESIHKTHRWRAFQWEQEVLTIPQKNSSVHFCCKRWLQMLLLMAPDPHIYPLLKNRKIKYSTFDHVSSSGSIYFSNKNGKDTGSPCVIFFRTLVSFRTSNRW